MKTGTIGFSSRNRLKMPKPTPTEPSTRKLEIHLPAVTIVKVLGTLFLLWSLVELRLELFLILVSVLLAIAFDTPVRWTEKRGWGRAVGVALVGIVMLG